jgi:medium-chain acyl-[acyl-carrier-protein] hydrolase
MEYSMEALPIDLMESRTRYYFRPRPVSNPSARLIAFPYAGASAVVFHQWASSLSPDIELVSIQYPGRSTLIGKKPCTSIQELAEESYKTLATLSDTPFYFFGHSMGGNVAFETARLLAKEGMRSPQALVLSACNPPQSASSLRRQLHTLPDDEFLVAIEQYGGMPSEILQSPDMLAYFLPLLRADMKALETWVCVSEAPLDVPILVLGGDNDRSVDSTQLQRWRDFTNADFECQVLPGNHFFFQHRLTLVINKILSLMERF